ncbi:MAG: ABC-F family ATP-binding cassette domain-containing protein [Fimbriimonas sp.]
MILAVHNVRKEFGTDIVLDGVTFRLENREKVALVGRNGTGKTTLLKILTGQLKPDGGTVTFARGAKLGYLRQEAPVNLGRTVIEEAESGAAERLILKQRLEELELRIENDPTPEDLDEYALLHEHFLDAEGYSAERDVRVVLQRMGFEEAEFTKPTAKLSGGEKTRLAIARLLLEEPDLLILDEPTNHLDLQATEWLESWLIGYHGAVLLVSHDRAFLDRTAERVIEMRDGTVKTYPGPFPKFLQLRAEEDARQAEVARRQDHEIAKMDEYVRRFMNSQRTAQARGRLKLMNRLVASKVEAPKNDKGMKAGFGKVQRSGDITLETKDLGMAFEDEKLFSGLNWNVRWGDRWGVIGENGAGKSTLMRIILGMLEPTQGASRLGANVLAGFFNQDASDLDPEMSPLDTMVWDCDMQPGEARTLLGRFLLSGDDVYRPIKTLSGGEKNKLVLAKLTVLNPNLLILDEPTNHLDMASREALAEVLKDYQGTLILVSHDRWLLTQVCEQTLDMKRSGPIIYLGPYLDYRNKKPVVTETKIKAAPVAVVAKEPEDPDALLSPRDLSKEMGRVQKLVAELEEQVTQTEEDLKSVEDDLAHLPADADIYELTREHQRLQEAVAGSMAAWEEACSRLEKLTELQARKSS